MWCNLVGKKAGLGSLKGEVRDRKLGGEGGNEPVFLRSRIPSHYLDKVPLPSASPKAVRDRGLAEGGGESLQLGDKIKIALEKNSFWPFTVPVQGEDENYFSFVAFRTEMVGRRQASAALWAGLPISFPRAVR